MNQMRRLASWCPILIAGLLPWLATSQVVAQAVKAPIANDRGVLVDVELPLTETAARQIVTRLTEVAGQLPAGGERATVVLRIGGVGGGDTRFEASLILARWLTSPAAAGLRTVAWIHDEVSGHAVLPVLACEQLIVTENATFGPVSSTEDASDTIVQGFYRQVAERRAKIPVDAVNALLDPSLELVALGRIDGGWEIASGERLAELRTSGQTWNEMPLSAAGQPAQLTGKQLRDLRWAGSIAEDETGLLEALSLGGWTDSVQQDDVQRQGVLAVFDGLIHDSAVDRFERALISQPDTVNTVIVQLQSAGGDLATVMRLATFLSGLKDSGVRVVAYVPEEARGNAFLVALACERCYVGPQAILGGPGDSNVDAESMREFGPAIVELMQKAKRDENIALALLDPAFQIVQYTDQRTGRTVYFRPDEFAQRQDQERYVRVADLNTTEGFDAERVVQLKLADGTHETLAAASSAAGLLDVPEPIRQGGLVYAIETFGRKSWVSYLLLFVAMMALVFEAQTPGIGVPGFVGLVALGGFIWIKHLNGTAEWLEVMLLLAGIGCLAIELLILPGFGIFGIGGLIMIIASLVLISQTFVLPRNAYQYGETTSALVGVLVAGAGVGTGIFLLQRYLPKTPGLKHLMMAEATVEELAALERREAIAHYERFLGQVGEVVTPLVPAGKARFGNETVGVISSGDAVDPGARVRVVQVQGSRVIVEQVS